MPSFDSGGFDDGLGGISLPPAQPPKSVLKKPPSVLDKGKSILCPGVPSCLPPPIADYEVEEYEETTRKRKIKFGDESYEPGDESDEDGEEKESRRGGGGGGGETLTTTPAPQPNSLQKKMLAMAGQDLDQFMKEMEVVHKTREAEKAAELSQRLARLEGEDGSIAPPGIEVGSSVVSRIVLKRSLCIYPGPSWRNASRTTAWWPSFICWKVSIHLTKQKNWISGILFQGLPIRVCPTLATWHGTSRGSPSPRTSSWETTNAPSSIHSQVSNQ